jgi:hypothetical protein
MTSPGSRSYSAVRCGQAAANRMILWARPLHTSTPRSCGDLMPVQSIKQPQLDLHSRLHNLGTYRVKAPSRSPLLCPGRKEQADDPLMADHPTGSDDGERRSSVKAGLTPNRRRRTVENDEYGAFIRRIVRAYSRRVADGDVEALSLMTGLAGELDVAVAEAVQGLRARATPGPRSAPGSASPARLHSNDGVRRANRSGSHADGQPCPPVNSRGQPTGGEPRSRTESNDTGRPRGHLRSRRSRARCVPDRPADTGESR